APPGKSATPGCGQSRRPCRRPRRGRRGRRPSPPVQRDRSPTAPGARAAARRSDRRRGASGRL
ncbi:MAG: hypothetical protein AVDCRST_MAG78-3732, partial [uncultured Rubrobacteraceae bacterium]